jgi:mannitol/fructose-specific phosphotransferase system IIA component (Ntr-type)
VKYIYSWLKKENLYINQKAESELEVIRILLDRASKSPKVTDLDQVADAVFENEIVRAKHRNCCGIAFEAASRGVLEPLIIIGRFEEGIGYYSEKKKPIDLAVLIIAPLNYTEQLQTAVADMKELLCDSIFMQTVRQADDVEKMYEVFRSTLEHSL